MTVRCEGAERERAKARLREIADEISERIELREQALRNSDLDLEILRAEQAELNAKVYGRG